PTPMLELEVADEDDLSGVAAHPERETAFVRVIVGACDLPRDGVMRALRSAFPRLHEVRWPDDAPTAAGDTDGGGQTYGPADVSGTVRRYLERELPGDDPDRTAVLALADRFLAEETNP